MYKILPKQLIFVGFAWIVLGTYVLFSYLATWEISIRSSLVPLISWSVLNVIFWGPVWRFLWKRIPVLERWIFPDLNGSWDVELKSNWPRQKQLIEAALSTDEPIDIVHCDLQELAPLSSQMLKAKITQTWWKIEMTMWNPNEDSPIDRSDTICVEPFRQGGFRPPGICYLYEQANRSDRDVSDEGRFFGAARLTYDFQCQTLRGLAWTTRMWPRAINTVAELTFTRGENS